MAKFSAIIKPQNYIEMNKIKELLDNSKLSEIEHPEKSAYWHLLKLREEMEQALNLDFVTARTFNVGEKATWRGMELFVAEVGNNEVLLATDMNVDAEDYNDWWVANVYAR